MDVRELLTEPKEAMRWGVALTALALVAVAAGLDLLFY